MFQSQFSFQVHEVLFGFVSYVRDSVVSLGPEQKSAAHGHQSKSLWSASEHPVYDGVSPRVHKKLHGIAFLISLFTFVPVLSSCLGFLILVLWPEASHFRWETAHFHSCATATGKNRKSSRFCPCPLGVTDALMERKCTLFRFWLLLFCSQPRLLLRRSYHRFIGSWGARELSKKERKQNTFLQSLWILGVALSAL